MSNSTITNGILPQLGITLLASYARRWPFMLTNFWLSETVLLCPLATYLGIGVMPSISLHAPSWLAPTNFKIKQITTWTERIGLVTCVPWARPRWRSISFFTIPPTTRFVGDSIAYLDCVAPSQPFSTTQTRDALHYTSKRLCNFTATPYNSYFHRA